MIKNYSLLFGIVASIFICLYLSMYILRNIYYYFENKSFRKFINKLLTYILKIQSFIINIGFNFFSTSCNIHIYLY